MFKEDNMSYQKQTGCAARPVNKQGNSVKYVLALAPLATTAVLPRLAHEVGAFLWCEIDPTLAAPCFVGNWNIEPLLSAVVRSTHQFMPHALLVSVVLLGLCAAIDLGWRHQHSRIGTSI
jgi:hypothetical protein